MKRPTLRRGRRGRTAKTGPLVSPTGRPMVLDGVRPNAGLAARYRRQLDMMISQMDADITREIMAAYRSNPPEMASDASPAADLQSVIAGLGRKWLGRFSKLAPELAKYFAQAVGERSDYQLQAILKRGGFTVDFRISRQVNDILQAITHENVALIKSIASQHLTQVEGMVMRSVTAGRDLETLNRELRETFGVTKRRAALIARDQNNKATAVITRARQEELGIQTAQWMHSHAGKTPRPSHLKAGRDGVIYDVKQGWFDPDEQKWIWPGTLINCGCFSKPIIPGFE